MNRHPDSVNVASIAAEKSLAVDFFHVLGSSSADPQSVPNPIELRLREIPALIYHKVILGFVIEGEIHGG